MQVVAEAREERTAAPVEPEPGFVTPAQESTSLLAYCDMDEEGNYKCRLRDTGVMSMLHLQVMTEAHQGRLKWFLKEKKKTAVTAQASSSTAMAPAEGAASKAKSAPKKRVQEEVKMEEEPEPKTVKVDEEPKVESGSGMAAATAKVETEQATATAVEEAAGEVQEQPMQVAKTEEQAMEVDKVPEQPVAKTEEQAMEVDTKVEAMEVDTKVEAAVEAAVEAEETLQQPCAWTRGAHRVLRDRGWLGEGEVSRERCRGHNHRGSAWHRRPYRQQPELLLNEYKEQNLRSGASERGGRKREKMEARPAQVARNVRAQGWRRLRCRNFWGGFLDQPLGGRAV